MCIACEQDALWYAYLRRKGLINENGEPVEDVPIPGFAVQPFAVEQVSAPQEKDAPTAAAKSDFSRDDPNS
jgi:hypothetical protein